MDTATATSAEVLVEYETLRRGTVPAAAAARLLAEMIELDSIACGQPADGYWAQRAHLFDEATVTVARVDGRLVGFGCYQVWDEDVPIIYFDATAVHPDMARHGIARQVVQRGFHEMFEGEHTAFWITLRTQSPVVASGWLAGTLAKSGIRFFPDMSSREAPPDEVLAVAAVVARRLGGVDEPSPATLVQRGAYAAGGPVYANAPTEGAAPIVDFFAEHVDVDRGDAVIIVAGFGTGPA